jgi:hypothetical protein
MKQTSSLPTSCLPHLHAGRAKSAPDAAARHETGWIVLHTRSRQEKAVASQLTALGVIHFLPLLRQPRCYGRHKLAVDLPLFPCYLFLHGRPEQAYEPQRAGRLAQIIAVADQQTLDWELRNIRLALNAKAPLERHPQLSAGVRARVCSGPLRGLEGVIERRSRQNRLVLQVATLGMAVGLDIDSNLLEPLE